MSNAPALSKGLSDPWAEPSNASVDIVFVHGLNGDAVNTWTYEYADPTVCWPKDLLPKDITNARILSFGYHAEVVNFWSNDASLNTIDNHADDLITALLALRDRTETSDRPIILVAHSLGGLICQQALISGQNMPDEGKRKLIEQIGGIAFMGTPHEGSDAAAWGSLLAKFVSLFRVTNTKTLTDLSKGSTKLATLGKEFPNLVRTRESTKPVRIVCFFEGQNNAIARSKIVVEQSATMKGYDKFCIHADHIGMCKFSDKDDENYKRVRDSLQNLVKLVQKKPEEKDKASNTYNATTEFSGKFFGGLQQGQAISTTNHLGGGTYNFGRDDLN